MLFNNAFIFTNYIFYLFNNDFIHYTFLILITIYFHNKGSRLKKIFYHNTVAFCKNHIVLVCSESSLFFLRFYYLK